MKKKIVYIAPHLSTGGMPQYLVKQIESIKEHFEVYCIEWDNVTGGVLVVQRNKMVNLLGDKLITLGENKHELFKALDIIKPDVVHLQEIPELFMSGDVAKKLYKTDRTYTIIETSHDSGYTIDRKIYLPDKFLMVSEFQRQLYRPLNIPCDVVEYPIENKIRTKTREQTLRDLGLDPALKHVINVGLFTPRKNQAEIIEYARMLQNYPIQFHFIGNQADNFRFYWEPLMQNLPSNCKWWNERSDVDSFYEAADLFLFTSRGHSTDRETMPLVIRESLGWKTPSLIYNLPVYMGYFDTYDSIEYLTDDLQRNTYRIAEKLLVENTVEYPKVGNPPVYNKEVEMFNCSVNPEEQKVYYVPVEEINFPVSVIVKDIDSKKILWSVTHETLHAGHNYWILPAPKNIIDFQDKNFGGLLVEFHKLDKVMKLSKSSTNDSNLIQTVRFKFNTVTQTPIEKTTGTNLSSENCIIISAYPNTGASTEIVKQCILRAKKFNLPIILTSHCDIPEELQNLADYCIVDRKNIHTLHTHYQVAWWNTNGIHATVNLTGEGNNIYHGPAVHTNYYNGMSLAKGLGFTNAICWNYDWWIEDEIAIKKPLEGLRTKKAVMKHGVAEEGNVIATVWFAMNIDFFMKTFPTIHSEDDYKQWMTDIGSESNGLENMWYNTLKNKLDDVQLMHDEFYLMFPTSQLDICSRIEYFTLLPIEGNDEQLVIWYSSNNVQDDRTLNVYVNNELAESVHIHNRTQYYRPVNKTDVTSVKFEIVDRFYNKVVFDKTISVDADYLETKLTHNGIFKYENS